jgi:hypothetical protein
VNSKINYKVEDFLRDDEFICCALNISSEAYTKWESLLKKYSGSTNEAEKAKAILTGESMMYTLEPEESDKLKRSIFASLAIE